MNSEISTSVKPVPSTDVISTGSYASEPKSEKVVVVDPATADDDLEFMKQWDSQVRELTPEENLKLGRKVIIRIISLTFVVNIIMSMAKAVITYNATSGLFEHTGLTKSKYNDCLTLYYVGYFVGQIPAIWFLRNVPTSKLLFCLCTLWGIIVFLTNTAYNFPGVLMLQLFLGVSQAPALGLLVSSNGQFLTSREHAATTPIFYAASMLSSIPLGFISYGTLFAEVSFGQYRILNIIIGGLTLLMAVIIWFVYPDDPRNAIFLTTEERVWVIRRVQRTQHITLHQHAFNYSHVVEALKDPVSWLICGFFLLQQLANNFSYQQTTLYDKVVHNNPSEINSPKSNLNTTIITTATEGFAIIWSMFSAVMLWCFPNTTCFTIIWSLLPSFVGAIVAVSLPTSNTTGVLAAVCLGAQSFGVAYICAFRLGLGTAGSSFTKRLVRGGMMLQSYSVSNIISPHIWQDKEGPRYIPAWVVQIVVSLFVAPALIGIVWIILARRNKQRIRENVQVYGVDFDEEGNRLVIDAAALGMTDLEDRTFIYPL